MQPTPYAFFKVRIDPVILTVPSDKLQLMAEMLTRINSGLMIGNFEMDFEDGELRYKTSIDYENELTDSLIHNIISVNIMTVDSFSKALIVASVLPG